MLHPMGMYESSLTFKMDQGRGTEVAKKGADTCSPLTEDKVPQ